MKEALHRHDQQERGRGRKRGKSEKMKGKGEGREGRYFNQVSKYSFSFIDKIVSFE